MDQETRVVFIIKTKFVPGNILGRLNLCVTSTALMIFYLLCSVKCYRVCDYLEVNPLRK